MANILVRWVKYLRTINSILHNKLISMNAIFINAYLFKEWVKLYFKFLLNNKINIVNHKSKFFIKTSCQRIWILVNHNAHINDVIKTRMTYDIDIDSKLKLQIDVSDYLWDKFVSGSRGVSLARRQRASKHLSHGQ